MRLPADFAELPWEDLDFLGWRDPGAPLRAYLVVPAAAPGGAPAGIALRVPERSRTSAVQSSLCRICLTGHAASGVTLFSAPRAGAAGAAATPSASTCAPTWAARCTCAASASPPCAAPGTRSR